MTGSLELILHNCKNYTQGSREKIQSRRISSVVEDVMVAGTGVQELVTDLHQPPNFLNGALRTK